MQLCCGIKYSRFALCNLWIPNVLIHDLNKMKNSSLNLYGPDKNTVVKHSIFVKVCVCQPFKLNRNGKRNYFTHAVVMNIARTGFEQHIHGAAYDVLWQD